MKKRSFLSVVLISLLALSFIVPTASAAAGTYGPFNIRLFNAGDYDAVYVRLDPGQQTFGIKGLKMYGIHAGENASFKLNIYDSNDNLVASNQYNSDVNNIDLGVSNLSPGGTYQVVIESTTNHDMQGGFSIFVYGSAYK